MVVPTNHPTCDLIHSEDENVYYWHDYETDKTSQNFESEQRAVESMQSDSINWS